MRHFIKLQTKGVEILAGYSSSITASGRKGLAQTLSALFISPPATLAGPQERLYSRGLSYYSKVNIYFFNQHFGTRASEATFVSRSMPAPGRAWCEQLQGGSEAACIYSHGAQPGERAIAVSRTAPPWKEQVPDAGNFHRYRNFRGYSIGNSQKWGFIIKMCEHLQKC